MQIRLLSFIYVFLLRLPATYVLPSALANNSNSTKLRDSEGLVFSYWRRVLGASKLRALLGSVAKRMLVSNNDEYRKDNETPLRERFDRG